MVNIRKATKADGDAVLSVHCEAVRAVSTDQYSNDEVVAWASAQNDPTQYPFEDETQHLAVAEVDDQIVGFVGLDLEGGVLETLYVQPDSQGEGIGSLLLDHAEKIAREHGHSVLLMAASLNAVPFYRQRGYTKQDASYMLEMGSETLEFVRMEKALD